jgi:atlastin
MSEPIQIISIGESNDFILNEDNLSNIIDKIPANTKVGVVSVVGAFRTGKSFLLNFFLRYLRSSETCEPDMSEDWMTEEGDELSEGNLNDMKKSNEINDKDIKNDGNKSFAWRGGQERQTTGIYMYMYLIYESSLSILSNKLKVFGCGLNHL